jgi:hypothetical protein
MMVNFNLLKHVGLLPDGGGVSGRGTSGLGTRQARIVDEPDTGCCYQCRRRWWSLGVNVLSEGREKSNNEAMYMRYIPPTSLAPNPELPSLGVTPNQISTLHPPCPPPASDSPPTSNSSHPPACLGHPHIPNPLHRTEAKTCQTKKDRVIQRLTTYRVVFPERPEVSGLSSVSSSCRHY